MTSLIQTRIDNKVKVGAEQVLKSMGMSLNDAIRIFLSQVTMERALPFTPCIVNKPNEETLATSKRAGSKIGLKKVKFSKLNNSVF